MLPAKDLVLGSVKGLNSLNMKRSLLLLLPFFALILISGTIDLDQLFQYADQPVPAYITRDNTDENFITDEGATLGRVLFYDKSLSANNTVSCASCHHQEFAFSDTAVVSVGLDGGVTGRHSMRLINSRFSGEPHFFWDERAATLEAQATMPIKDHIEMGFSGTDWQPGFDSLIRKLEGKDYYQKLFTFAYGDPEVTEERIQLALAQFVRSIQSFDSKFDEGRRNAPADPAPFANFTQLENMGKQLFLAPPPMGAGCAGCHQPPEFSIDPNTRNNGVIGVAGDPDAVDITNTNAPTLRDLFNPRGELNGPMMHDGSMKTIEEVIEHYNAIELHPLNFNLDPRLAGPPGANGQRLNLSQVQKDALVAFLKTLSGTNVYTDERWSDPFDENGNIEVIGGSITSTNDSDRELEINVYPNPTYGPVQIAGLDSDARVIVFDQSGRALISASFQDVGGMIDLGGQPAGIYFLRIETAGKAFSKKLLLQ